MENIKRLARRAVGERPNSNVPVEVAPGAAAPKLEGESWHYETRTGLRIRHPSAYASRGWSSMVYCPSTRLVVVGKEWHA